MKQNVIYVTLLAIIAGLLIFMGNDRINDRKSKTKYVIEDYSGFISSPESRTILKQLSDLKNVYVKTTTIWRASNGKVIGMCDSTGYGYALHNSIDVNYKDVGKHETSKSEARITKSSNVRVYWVLCLDVVGNIAPVKLKNVGSVEVYPTSVEMSDNELVHINSKTNVGIYRKYRNDNMRVPYSP